MPRKHVLVLVHGMGDYVDDDGGIDSGWADRAEATLEELYAQYSMLKLMPFEDRFEVVKIDYDTVFNDLITKWAHQSVDLKSAGVPIEGVVKEVFDWLDGGAKQTDNFAWTHVADVVLYRYFRLVRQRVKVHVAKQIVAALKPNAHGSVGQWTVIAHSLGTIVAHDVLHALSVETAPETGLPILDTMVPSATAFVALSNVSKVLENDAPVYDSEVVPPTELNPTTVCFNYLSADNRYDPFLLLERFDPKDDPEWKLARKQKSYLPVRTKNVQELNVHSFRNYMVNPAVHIPLFDLIVGPGFVLPDERAQAERDFEQIADDALLKEAQKLAKDSKAETWFERIGKFYALLEEARS